MSMKTVIILLIALVAASQAQVTCNDVHYWIEEGKLLKANLQEVPTYNTNFQDKLWTPPANPQAGVVGSCPASGILTFGAAPQGTFHYTSTPDGYTPKYKSFAQEFDTTTGKFKYIHIPTLQNAVVWNGYDSFRFSAKCDGVEACSATAAINVVYTSRDSQNQTPSPFNAGNGNVVCNTNTNCRNKADGMWLARQTLPRVWDMQKDESNNDVKPTIVWNNEVKDTDGLDFEWTSNYAVISTYGAISNMAQRFPTFELLNFVPGSQFDAASLQSSVAPRSTGFDQACLNEQSFSGQGSDVWTFNTAQTDGQRASNPFPSTASYYNKFGGAHAACDTFVSKATHCKYAPLLSPRPTDNEDDGGVWKVAIDGCATKWTGKFTWKGMNTQTLKNTNKAMLIENADNRYTITSEIYNQAVQPNSWTQPSRGYVSIDHKYLLKVVLAQDTQFEFELGIDTFTVDLQQFRYQNEIGDYSFGFNMIVYPRDIVGGLPVGTPQSQPDRRIKGFKWTEQQWIAPNSDQCPSCYAQQGPTPKGKVDSISNAPSNSEADPQPDNRCVSADASNVDYEGAAFPTGNCASPLISLIKGPATGQDECSETADANKMIIRGVAGISKQDSCNVNFQNITLRGSAPGSGNNGNGPAGRAYNAGGFGFEGKITLTFLLANGEHPHFVITPKMYVKSISIDGAFQGTSSTCRGSPYWPVGDTVPIATSPVSGRAADKNWVLDGCQSGNCDSLPKYICEEPDARTFGPTDWASIFFDIKDVDANLVEMTKLSVKFGDVTTNQQLTIRFFPEPDTNAGEKDYSPQYLYLNYRNLKGRLRTAEDGDEGTSLLQLPTAPSNVVPPKNTDFGFSFTPGAHNENTKITIYCTLRIKTSGPARSRRFGAKAAEDKDAENTIQERIDINRKSNAQLSSLSSNNRVVEAGSANSSNQASAASSSVTVMVLAAACAVLLAAVIGMVLYVVRTKNAEAPKRVNSSA